MSPTVAIFVQTFELLNVDYRSDDAPSTLTKSLRDTGFAVVANHPIDVSRIDGLYAQWRDFFASEQKFDYLFDPSVQDG